ncbi:MAG TPA: hypothetical protein DCS93_27130 [Microscillaceae bacterium]|nr:hypothetical protein [Microscillaceae bacterium]
MTNIKTCIFIVFLCFLMNQSFAQSVNWQTLKNNRHIAHIHTSWDHGLVYGLGYSYQLKLKTPILLQASYSLPSGNQLLDDFKVKLGGQVRFYKINYFQFSASLYALYRRFQNPLVRLQNFGTELSIVAGYYKSRWFIAGEFGFDKAVVTHFKHSDRFKTFIYTNVQDGWAEPATGGNFYYGLQAGVSFYKSDLVLKAGLVSEQSFQQTPIIPYYLQLGYNLKIK